MKGDKCRCTEYVFCSVCRMRRLNQQAVFKTFGAPLLNPCFPLASRVLFDAKEITGVDHGFFVGASVPKGTRVFANFIPSAQKRFSVNALTFDDKGTIGHHSVDRISEVYIKLIKELLKNN